MHKHPDQHPIDGPHTPQESNLVSRRDRMIFVGAPPSAGFVIGMAELTLKLGELSNVALNGLRTHFGNRSQLPESMEVSTEPTEPVVVEL